MTQRVAPRFSPSRTPAGDGRPLSPRYKFSPALLRRLDGVWVDLSPELARQLAQKSTAALADTIRLRRRQTLERAEAMAYRRAEQALLAEERDAERRNRALWRRVKVKTPKETAPERKPHRPTRSGFLPGASALPALSGTVVDRLGRRGIFLRIRYYGRKTTRPGVGRRVAMYVYQGALERADGSLCVFSNVAESPREAIAAMELLEQVNREASIDAKLLFHLIANVPDQLTVEQMLEEARLFAEAQFGCRDLPYVVALHPPSEEGDQRNWHIHILASTRPMRRVGDHEWDFGDHLRTEIDNPAQFLRMRKLYAAIQTEVAQEAGLDLAYTALSNVARGLPTRPQEHLGALRTELARRGETVAANERNREAVVEGERALLDEQLRHEQEAATKQAALIGRAMAPFSRKARAMPLAATVGQVRPTMTALSQETTVAVPGFAGTIDRSVLIPGVSAAIRVSNMKPAITISPGLSTLPSCSFDAPAPSPVPAGSRLLAPVSMSKGEDTAGSFLLSRAEMATAVTRQAMGAMVPIATNVSLSKSLPTEAAFPAFYPTVVSAPPDYPRASTIIGTYGDIDALPIASPAKIVAGIMTPGSPRLSLSLSYATSPSPPTLPTALALAPCIDTASRPERSAPLNKGSPADALAHRLLALPAARLARVRELGAPMSPAVPRQVAVIASAAAISVLGRGADLGVSKGLARSVPRSGPAMSLGEKVEPVLASADLPDNMTGLVQLIARRAAAAKASKAERERRAADRAADEQREHEIRAAEAAKREQTLADQRQHELVEQLRAEVAAEAERLTFALLRDLDPMVAEFRRPGLSVADHVLGMLGRDLAWERSAPVQQVLAGMLEDQNARLERIESAADGTPPVLFINGRLVPAAHLDPDLKRSVDRWQDDHVFKALVANLWPALPTLTGVGAAPTPTLYMDAAPAVQAASLNRQFRVHREPRTEPEAHKARTSMPSPDRATPLWRLRRHHRHGNTPEPIVSRQWQTRDIRIDRPCRSLGRGCRSPVLNTRAMPTPNGPTRRAATGDCCWEGRGAATPNAFYRWDVDVAIASARASQATTARL